MEPRYERIDHLIADRLAVRSPLITVTPLRQHPTTDSRLRILLDPFTLPASCDRTEVRQFGRVALLSVLDAEPPALFRTSRLTRLWRAARWWILVAVVYAAAVLLSS